MRAIWDGGRTFPNKPQGGGVVRFRIVIGAAALVLVGWSPPAAAQVFGQFNAARPLPVNGHEFGGYVEFSENLLGFVGQLRLSFHPGVDFGFQGGLGRYDSGASDVTTARLGTDFKYLAASMEQGSPVDLGIGAAIGLETGDGLSLLSLGPSLVASRPVTVGGEPRLVPYASVALLFSRVDAGAGDTNDFTAPIRVGTEIDMGPGLRASAELKLLLGETFQDDVSLAVGIRTSF
jgi:hypothetical protein